MFLKARDGASGYRGAGAVAIIAYRRVRDRHEITWVGRLRADEGNRSGGEDRHITWPGRRIARAAQL